MEEELIRQEIDQGSNKNDTIMEPAGSCCFQQQIFISDLLANSLPDEDE
jgi:hypothetical protein